MLILLFPALGIIAFFLINQLGGRHIQQSYQNDLFDDEFGKSSVFNIAFRIIAPVVVLASFGLICFFIGFRFEFSYLLILRRNLLDPPHFGMDVKAPNRSL